MSNLLKLNFFTNNYHNELLILQVPLNSGLNFLFLLQHFFDADSNPNPPMPLSIVPSTVCLHVPEVHAENVPAASPTNVSTGVSLVTVVPTNVPHVDMSHDAIPTDLQAAVDISHVDIPIDLHVDIPHSIPTDLPPLDLNSETTISPQNHATQHVSAPTSIHPMNTRALNMELSSLKFLFL
ncbi:hypothetical protein U1Q18_012796 [Sarracenia purpurea var. burkii]